MENLENLKIESQDLAIDSLFKDFFSVPDFQREYVWEHENVEKMLIDIFDEFYDDGHQNDDTEYFLGSIVGCRDKKTGIIQLIDGQQRMTTIYLILCAARDSLNEHGQKPPDWLNSSIRFVAADPKTGNDMERHRLTLQYDDSDGILESIVSTVEPASSLPETTESVRKILLAYRTVRGFYQERFRDDPSEIKKFLVAFTQRTKLIRILTPSVANALKVFETINDRGVGLNAMDLLKNLLFMKTDTRDYPKLKDKWKILVDILDRAKEKPLRFLRYYIMSHFELDYSKVIREDEIYDWFVKNTSGAGIDKNPLGFADKLIECAKAHANFLQSKDVAGNEHRYLRNIALLGGALRQHHILLMAGRHLEPELFDRLCAAVENLFFCYMVTREPTKTFERNFARWSQDLRKVANEEHLDAFLDKYIVKDMKDRVNRFNFAFKELTQDSIQQYRIRYILAKLTQYIEEEAWGNPAHGRLDYYVAKNVEIEHILSQNPKQELRDSFDKSDEYDDWVRKLGNLTLLEKTINSSISRESFQVKSPGYRQSAFLLTKSLVEKPHVGSDTQLNRAVADLKQFTKWTSESIESQQEMLSALALRVWDMPELPMDGEK